MISFAMWKSYLFAATALGSFGWAKPTGPVLGVDVFDETPRLRFEKDGGFKIAVMEDLHFGEGEDNRKFSFCYSFCWERRSIRINPFPNV
jgi:hypothetical protein